MDLNVVEQEWKEERISCTFCCFVFNFISTHCSNHKITRRKITEHMLLLWKKLVYLSKKGASCFSQSDRTCLFQPIRWRTKTTLGTGLTFSRACHRLYMFSRTWYQFRVCPRLAPFLTFTCPSGTGSIIQLRALIVLFVFTVIGRVWSRWFWLTTGIGCVLDEAMVLQQVFQNILIINRSFH